MATWSVPLEQSDKNSIKAKQSFLFCVTYFLQWVIKFFESQANFGSLQVCFMHLYFVIFLHKTPIQFSKEYSKYNF